MRVCGGSHLNGVVHCLTFVVIHSVADVVLLENVIPLIIIIIIEEGFYLNSVILDLALLVLDSDALLFGHRRVFHLQKHIPQVFLKYSTILQFYTNKSYNTIWGCLSGKTFQCLRWGQFSTRAIFGNIWAWDPILYKGNIWEYLGVGAAGLSASCLRERRLRCLFAYSYSAALASSGKI